MVYIVSAETNLASKFYFNNTEVNGKDEIQKSFHMCKYWSMYAYVSA